MSLLFSHPYPKVKLSRRVSLSYTSTNKKKKIKKNGSSLHPVSNAKTAYSLMMLLHASLAFISVEIRFHSEFAELSLEMGMGEHGTFLVSSVSLGLLPLILEVSEKSPMEIFSDRRLLTF